MKTNSGSLLVVLSLPLASIACGLGLGGNHLPPPAGTSGEAAPLYPGARSIAIEQEDRAAFVVAVIGQEYLLFSHRTEIQWTEDLGSEVIEFFDSELPGKRWRLEEDWISFPHFSASLWRNGDLRLSVAVFDNLTSDDLNDLQRTYGISGPTPGSTLYLAHMWDTSRALPDETATAEAVSAQATGTSRALQVQMTGTAEAANQAATATAHSIAARATATAEAVRVAVEATQEAEATATARAELARQLADLSDEFDAAQLREVWTVYRPDPAAWDPGNRPGWLHLVGHETPSEGVRNALGMSVPRGDLSVISRIETNASDPNGQYVWIAFSNGDYSRESAATFPNESNVPGQTIELGIASTPDGYVVYMWACPIECNQWPDSGDRLDFHYVEDLGREAITTDGPVYLRLAREGQHYTGYWSRDGVRWAFVGEENQFSPETPQVFLGAAHASSARAFDAYFDFVRYESLGQ